MCCLIVSSSVSVLCRGAYTLTEHQTMALDTKSSETKQAKSIKSLTCHYAILLGYKPGGSHDYRGEGDVV